MPYFICAGCGTRRVDHDGREGLGRRLTDSLETALRLAEGVAEVEIVPREGEEAPEILTFSQHLACPKCGSSFEEPAPRNFSFNSPYGACERCDGLGTRFEVDPELVIRDDEGNALGVVKVTERENVISDKVRALLSRGQLEKVTQITEVTTIVSLI